VSDIRTNAEEHVKRVELLLHENNILTKQNAELDKEVARINGDNEGLAKRLLEATQQHGEIHATLKHKEAEVMSMASTCAPSPHCSFVEVSFLV
jgi:predicted  nucleic acid-binding Zn-ribbon protein